MLCVGATLFSGGLRVKPVGRWVIWREGGEGAENRPTGQLILLKMIMVTKKNHFGLRGPGGALYGLLKEEFTFAAKIHFLLHCFCFRLDAKYK